ncbi:chemotaxis protein [Bacillus sp. NRRL B-14911]|uniref:CheW-like domain-containing protein n=2 Tax=Bacillus infantis TaxID=324767 RepID=U5LDD5_9BACI|nr:hypothetical protein N288_17645 [Bacillus infantis NRRL B-14911]EAR65259.1 chemotaxis protein [Bacillus sp. NRRL B-14911]
MISGRASGSSRFFFLTEGTFYIVNSRISKKYGIFVIDMHSRQGLLADGGTKAMDENKKMIVFQVGKEEYAIPIEYVISIEKAEDITPIPHLPAYVKGISKVRGELIPVIDFEHILYDRSQADSDAARMIVLQTEELSLGASVAEAKEIIDMPKEAVKELGLAAYQKTTYFSGVAALGSRLITIIDPLRLVQALEGIREIKEFMKDRKEEAV